jgi:hypothetical protein
MSTGTKWDWHYDRMLPETEMSDGIYIWNVGDCVRRLSDGTEGVVITRTALTATLSINGRWVTQWDPHYYADADPIQTLRIDQFDKGWLKL